MSIPAGANPCGHPYRRGFGGKYLPPIDFCDIIRRLRDGQTTLSLYAVKMPILTLEESVPLSQTKHIYELNPLGASALKLHCKTSSPTLIILEIDPFGNPIQFVSLLPNEGRNNDVNREACNYLSG